MAGIVAKNYCDAIFALAVENDKLDIYKEQLCFVMDSLKVDTQFSTVMNHPKITKKEKKELIDSIYGEQVEHTLLNFFKLLVDKGRFRNIEDITKEFMKNYHKERNIQVVYLQSAKELKSEEIAHVQQILELKLEKKVELVCSIKAELMAGIRMKINDQMIDNSAYMKLERLKKQVVVSEIHK